MANKKKHPATYTKTIIEKISALLCDYNKALVLDPFAGTGKLALIKEYGYKGKVICNEIEIEWTKDSPYLVDEWHVGDAVDMNWAEDNSIDAICTSPTYGNRMADHFNSKDNSKRITYKHYLGRDLDTQNTGRMQWGKKYRDKHIEVYKECIRVLTNGGLFILNISDHIRKGVIVPVTQWHKDILLAIDLELIEHIKIETPRMRYGRNNKARVPHEDILVFQKKNLEKKFLNEVEKKC